MFNYLEASQVGDCPFIILGEPVRIYKTNYAYSKEGGYEEYNLPRNLTCYLADESKAPYEKIMDSSGNEISNLVYYNKDGNTHKIIVDNEEREVTPVDYNFFNYPAEVMVENKNGEMVPYRRKWLSAKVRVKAVFLTPCEAEVYNSETKKKEKSMVTHAKLDIPAGLFGRIEDAFETVREAKENPDMPMTEVEIAVKYDENKPPAECYTVKVKPTKAKVDLEKEEEEFMFKKAEFIPPTKPF